MMNNFSNRTTNQQAQAREQFRARLRYYSRRADIKLGTLAKAVGLCQSRFSERLTGRNNAHFFTSPEIMVILDYLDNHNAFFESSERADLLLVARACEYGQEQVQLPILPATKAGTIGVAGIESGSTSSCDQLVLTTALTTTVTATLTITTTTTHASNLELSQPSQPQAPNLTRNLLGVQKPLAPGDRTIQVNLGNTGNEQAIASELARLLLGQLVQTNAQATDSNNPPRVLAQSSTKYNSTAQKGSD